jgi:hypothetical protein
MSHPAAELVSWPNNISVEVMHTREGIRKDPFRRTSTALSPPADARSRNTILDTLVP